MESTIRLAERRYRPLKIFIGGIAGSGKTIGSLKLALGIAGDLKDVCVIDSENNSSNLYAHLGKYSVLPISEFSPQSYIAAIKKVEDAGFKVCIIDSMSHEWSGPGGSLEIVDRVTKASRSGNSYMAWGEVTPQHQAFLTAIIQTPMHVIGTFRQKDEYVIETNERGKSVPKKIGLKNITREGTDYEPDLLFSIHGNHFVSVEKDRTMLFDGKPPFMLDASVGVMLKSWSLGEIDSDTPETITARIMSLLPEIKDKELKDKIELSLSEHQRNQPMLIVIEKRITDILKTK